MLDRIHAKLASTSELFHDDVAALRPLLGLSYGVSGIAGAERTALQRLLPEFMRILKLNLSYTIAFTNYMLDTAASEVPQTTREDLVRAVAQILGTISIDMRNQDTINGQVIAYERTKHTTMPERQPIQKPSAAAFGIFIKHFYGQGLYTSVGLMISNLHSEVGRALGTTLHTIWLPFLQELISLMLIYGIPFTDAIYSQFFECVLQEYFKNFVGQEPTLQNSAEHKSWQQRADAACYSLDSFDHSYFQEILGKKYESVVLSGMTKLPRFSSRPARDQIDSATALASTRSS